ncbi:aldo/keto reductase [Enterococcus sp. HY326]|uniref:aldo/keto reductase n=1 Tax=Enterococcus sp. HY326 TaxID=2971265 RepID=UPI00223ECA3F|nr:aldo/keto reductase [Enterococcus sp. HY326]
MQNLILNQRTLPAIGMGTWHMGDDFKRRQTELTALRSGLDSGAAVIDTAEMYGEGNSERLVGEALQNFPREKVYLISKVYPWNASLTELPKSLDQSLERLETDYLDLYLLHWRGTIPLAETVAAMEAAKQAGKIKAWGVSNFDTDDMEELWQVPGGQNCAANQVLYNLGERGIEFDLLPWLRKQNVPLIAYSPVAQGDSLGNQFTQQPQLQKIAEQHQASIFQILLAWVIRDGTTLAIPQSSNEMHVKANLAAGAVKLAAAELAILDELFPKPTQKQPLAML